MKKKYAYKGKLKYEIILICTLSTVLVGIVSNLILYKYLSTIISEKVDIVESNNFSFIDSELSKTLDDLSSLGYQGSNDYTVATALSLSYPPATLSQQRNALNAAETLQIYLNSLEIQNHIGHLVAFNEYGINIQPNTKGTSSATDPEKIMQLPLFQELEELQQTNNIRQIISISSSIENGEDCIALISPVYNYSTSAYTGWLYIELDINGITQKLSSSSDGSYFLASGDYLYSQGEFAKETFKNLLTENQLFNGNTLRVDSKVYKIYRSDLNVKNSFTYIMPSFSLYHIVDITRLASNGNSVLFITFVVIGTSLLIAIILVFFLSSVITKPINRLTKRLQKISENEFSFDPSIENGSNEIAKMGVVVNEMSASIVHLLKETEDMYKKRQNVEIALLQSQINPHFLYNTLDSIRWMATIQKNTGIVNMTRSLSNLLRNMAKGVGDKIPLWQELDLLKDYVDIQSIRYIETFEFKNNIPPDLLNYTIVKFTLQPLVENAIFHGIEPTGSYGIITVDAYEEGDDLLITVTDSGAGITQEKIDSILNSKATSNSNSLSGIGISNVHKRLKLQYGNSYGLTYTSVLNEYTTVTIRIPKEM